MKKNINIRSRFFFTFAGCICGFMLLILIFSKVFIAVDNNKNNNTNQTTSNVTNTPTIVINTIDLTPTTDPYAGWKDYYFAQYDISFKYPADWEVQLIDRPTEVNGINEPDMVPCINTLKVKPGNCKANLKNNLVTAYKLLIYKNASYIDFSVVQGDISTIPERETYTDKSLTITSTSFPAVEKTTKNISSETHVMYVNNIGTGNKSIFKSFNVYVSSTYTGLNDDVDQFPVIKTLLKSIK